MSFDDSLKANKCTSIRTETSETFPLPAQMTIKSLHLNHTQRCRATKGPARTSCFYNYDVLNGALEEKHIG